VSKDTSIEYADSSLNLMMGCDGCELWNRKAGIKICYAGNLTDRYGGENKGFPLQFEEPQLFLDRLDDALRWGDLTGKERKKKPWINGLPRIVFLNDMGDTFTESLPIDWLAPLLPILADSPHQWLLLTKRASRMRAFSEAHPLPANVWPGVSVTSEKTRRRLDDLVQVQGGGPKWVSVEPLWGPVDLTPYLADLRWVVPGGQSGNDSPHDMDLSWLRSILEQCRRAGVAAFAKQLGTTPYDSEDGEIRGKSVPLSDAKGGDWEEWPEELRVREMPKVTVHA